MAGLAVELAGYGILSGQEATGSLFAFDWPVLAAWRTPSDLATRPVFGRSRVCRERPAANAFLDRVPGHQRVPHAGYPPETRRGDSAGPPGGRPHGRHDAGRPGGCAEAAGAVAAAGAAHSGHTAAADHEELPVQRRQPAPAADAHPVGKSVSSELR
eukprot:scaffold4058_cov257-Pinguiococcus_pyrenoidosus.AAC.10